MYLLMQVQITASSNTEWNPRRNGYKTQQAGNKRTVQSLLKRASAVVTAGQGFR